MAKKKSEPLHVFDSSVWIDLAERHTEWLYRICDLAGHGVMRVGIPATVRDEVLRPGWVEQRKQSWQSRIGELIRFARMLDSDRDPFEPEDGQEEGYARVLERLRAEIGKFTDDPHRVMIARLFDGESVVKIGAPKAMHTEIVEWGLKKRAPFTKKNSMADACILLSVVRWAERHPGEEVVFYTRNTNDFSDPEDKSRPHPDIASLFGANTNMRYETHVRKLIESFRSFDIADLWGDHSSNPYGCTICDEAVLIESIGCVKCGDWPADAPDDESYTLKPYRDGFLVDVHPEYGDSFRLVCDECGRKTFDVELPSLCSYHDHMFSKDD